MPTQKPVLKDNGFTLIEVIASIVIISIVLISFSQIVVMNNKVAASNNDKLIAINLAEAELERIKIQPFEESFIQKPTDQPLDDVISEVQRQFINEGHNTNFYTVEFSFTQSHNEFNTKVIHVEVTVKYKDSKSKMEGYLAYDS